MTDITTSQARREFIEWSDDFCNRLGQAPTPWDAWQATLSHARSVAPGGLTDEQIESVWDKLLRTHGQHSREGRIAIARAILAATPTTVHPTPADGGRDEN
jgi:hypothetical protein